MTLAPHCTGTASVVVPAAALEYLLSLIEVLELEDWDEADEAAYGALATAAAREAPTFAQAIEAGCERVCMGCGGGSHNEGQHRIDVEPVVVELIDRGWLAISGPGEWSR